MNCRIKRALSVMLVCVAALIMNTYTVFADNSEDKGQSLIYVSGYEVTNETIIQGKEFDLKITVTNFSSDGTAENVIIVVTNPAGVVPEYGTVTNAYVEKIEPGKSATVKFSYSANADITATELNFNVIVACIDFGSETQLRIPVGRATDFSVDEYSIPKNMAAGRTGYVSAVIENVGLKGVSNVVMVVRCNGQDIASENIGTMAAKTSKTQYVGVTFPEAGEYPVEILVKYVSGDGANKEYEISSGIIKVEEDFGDNPTDTDPSNNPGQTQSEENQGLAQRIGVSNIVLLCVSGVLLIALCCVGLILVYRRR